MHVTKQQTKRGAFGKVNDLQTQRPERESSVEYGNESSGKDRKRTENSESSKLNAETLAES